MRRDQTFPQPKPGVGAKPKPGCLRFDRRFSECGVRRLQLSSGTKDPKEFAYRDGLLTRLAEGGHTETLQALAAGEITIAELVAMDRAGNLKHGLAEHRAQRTSATMSAPAIEDDAGETSLRRARGGWVGEYDMTETKLKMPLWHTAISETIPSMLDIVDASRRRYVTSMRSLRQKCATLALPEEDFQHLADVEEHIWVALHQARMRGITLEETETLAALDVVSRRESLRERDYRVGENTFAAVQALTSRQWEAIQRGGTYAPPLAQRLVLERLSVDERARVRSVGEKLGAAARFTDLATLSKQDWRALSKVWGASGSDWNHVRRSLSAVLSTHLGTKHHAFRHHVIDRVPLKKEVERVPDLSREKLQEIVAHLPESIRIFPWFLVLSGVRISEYLSLTPDHLRHNIHAIQVPGTKTESSVRDVFIAADAWPVVEQAVPCYLQYGQLRRHWMAACAKAGVEGVTVHDLRHCTGQWGTEGGADESALQDLFGHATRAMTEKYTKRVNKGRAARAISDHVLPFVEP